MAQLSSAPPATSSSSSSSPPSSSSTPTPNSTSNPSSRPLTPLDDLAKLAARRTRAVFIAENDNGIDDLDFGGLERAKLAKSRSKIVSEYAGVTELPPVLQAKVGGGGGVAGRKSQQVGGVKKAVGGFASDGKLLLTANGESGEESSSTGPHESKALVAFRQSQGFAAEGGQASSRLSQALMQKKATRDAKPDYHPPWKLKTVISGHLGWVRALAVEPGNQWFASGAGDRVIKIWDLASGELKVSLTGHISAVRGLAVSNRHPYLFSCAEDKMVKCWDLETNRVIRHYHGHLSGVYSLDIHPTLDVLVTAGRDATARVWDMRTKENIITLTGHTATVAAVKCQDSDPQVITASMDSTVRLWDLAAGKTMTTLTHHKKSVRALAIAPHEYSFATASAGGNNIKKWKCPEGTFVHNFPGHEAIINTLSINEEGVLFSGGDNGSLSFWDYKTGLPFQHLTDIPQAGSLDSEAGVFASTFDKTGTRLITGGADKTIKIYSEQ